MAVRDLALKLGLRAYERAKDLGDRIKVSVQRSTDGAKELRREIGAAVRERTQAARLLSADAKARAKSLQGVLGRFNAPAGGGAAGALGGIPGLEGSSLVGRATALAGVANQVVQGQVNAGEALFRQAGQFLPAGTREIHAFVTGLIDRAEQRLKRDLAEDTRRLLIDVRRDLESFEERMRTDPTFREQQAQAAFRAAREREEALRAAGLSPAASYLDTVDGDF